MATTVYTTEDVILQDGSEITLRRLNIKNQRLFMKTFTNLPTTETDDEATDQMVGLAQLCLRGALKGTEFEEKVEDTDWLEEALDEPTIYKIIEVCAGIKLNDPNLLAAAVAAMTQSEAAGTN